MPTPTTSYIIDLRLSGGTASVVSIDFRNGRTGDTRRVKPTTAAAIKISEKANLGNKKEFKNGVQNGDVIEITVTGARYGSINHTVDTSKGGAKVELTLADVSSTTHPKVSI